MRTEYSVSLRTQSECRKIRTRRDSVFGHFPRRLRGLFLIHLSQFVWTVNKLIGFYEMRPLVLNGINVNENNLSDAPLLSSTEKYYILLKRITPKHNLQKQPLEVFCEKRWSLKFRDIHRKNTCALGLRPSFIKKVTLVEVFSCEFCKLFKNTFSTEYHPDDCIWAWSLLNISIATFCNKSSNNPHLFQSRFNVEYTWCACIEFHHNCMTGFWTPHCWFFKQNISRETFRKIWKNGT